MLFLRHIIPLVIALSGVNAFSFLKCYSCQKHGCNFLLLSSPKFPISRRGVLHIYCSLIQRRLFTLENCTHFAKVRLKADVSTRKTSRLACYCRCLTFADCRLHTADRRLQTADCRLQTTDFRLQITFCIQRTSDRRLEETLTDC